MDKTNATLLARADAGPEPASPTCAAPFSVTAGSRSRLRPTIPSAALFSATRSRPRPRPAVSSPVPFSATRSRPRPALPSERADVDYSSYNPKKMKKLRLVSEEEWFPPQRHERHLTGTRFWTVLQKDLYHSLKSLVSEMRWIDWASVNRSTGTDVRRYFAATPGLDKLLEKQDLGWADSYIRQFYATLWVHPDRSRIRFMFRNQQHELSRHDFAKYLGLCDSGARVHDLAYPNGSRDKVHLPHLESFRHFYVNPDAVRVLWKDYSQLNHETAVVYTVTRMSIRPKVGSESLTALEIWLLHLLMSEKPVDMVDLMIGEMQEIILSTRRRRLPYAPYLLHLFDKKGWLVDAMKKDLNQRLKQYIAPKPDDKRRLKNRAVQHIKSYKAPETDGKGRLGTRSLPPWVETGFDHEHAELDHSLSPSLEQHAELDHSLSPSLEQHALGKTTNGEDDHDLQMVPAPVPYEFRFSQQGGHDAEAGGSGGQAYSIPPMLQSQVDRQTAILEQIQGQLAEIRQQHEHDRQENRDLRNLVVILLAQTHHNSSYHRDILALLDKSFSAFCKL